MGVSGVGVGTCKWEGLEAGNARAALTGGG